MAAPRVNGERCSSSGRFRLAGASVGSLTRGLVLEILISDRHPLPFVLALIEGRPADIFPPRVLVEREREDCE